MSAITEILSSINQKRNAAANPVISEAVAKMLGEIHSSASFDAEEDTEILLAPLPNRFTTSAYSRMAWALDTQLKNDLKSVETSLESKFDPNDRFESFAQIENELDEKWGSEGNSYESGFQDSGILHRIAAILNVRLAYHENAETKMRSQRKMYTVQSIEAQLGNPQHQKLGKNDLANFRFNAMSVAHIETDIEARKNFDQGVIWMNEVAEKATSIQSMEAGDPKKLNSERITSCKARIDELSKYIENLSDPVREGLATYFKFVEEKQALLDKWYQAELDRIPVMNTIKEYCTKKVTDEKLRFSELPPALQIHLLTNIDASLTQTMAGLTGAAPELYRDYKAAVDELHIWFNKAIDLRFEGNDAGHADVKPEQPVRRARKSAMKSED